MEGGALPGLWTPCSHTNRLGQELPESVCAAPVTRRGGRLLQQLNKGQLLLSLNIPIFVFEFNARPLLRTSQVFIE